MFIPERWRLLFPFALNIGLASIFARPNHMESRQPTECKTNGKDPCAFGRLFLTIDGIDVCWCAATQLQFLIFPRLPNPFSSTMAILLVPSDSIAGLQALVILVGLILVRTFSSFVGSFAWA